MRRTIPFVSLFLLQTVCASAQYQPQAFHRTALACRADIHALCRNVVHGDGRVLACLEFNGRALSPTCREAIALVELRRGGVPQRN